MVRFIGLTPASIRYFGFIDSQRGRLQLICAISPWLLFSFYWEAEAKIAAAAAR